MNAVELLKNLWERPEEPRVQDEWGRPLINIKEKKGKRDIIKWVRRFANDCWLVEIDNGGYQVVRPESREWEDRPVCRKCRQ